MILKPWFVTCIAILAATPALARSASASPLHLSLPLQFAPAAASTAHGTAKPVPPVKNRQHDAPPAKTHVTDAQPPFPILPACNNKAYKKTHVFGSVGMGVFSGSDINGNYEAGRVNVAKALGSCSHPSGGLIFSFGFGRQTVNGPWWPG